MMTSVSSPITTPESSISMLKQWPTNGWKISDVWKNPSQIDQKLNLEILRNLWGRFYYYDPRIRSFLLVRRGEIVFEYYRRDLGSSTLHVCASVTKSIMGMLIGVALKEKVLGNVEQPIAEFLPESFAESIDPRVRELTIKHLLTMTPGFEWNQRNMDAASNDQDAEEPLNVDPVTGCLSRKFCQSPGSGFNYDNMISHLLSVLLTRASKMKTEDFARQFLFDVLGISNFRWSTDSYGFNWGSHGLQLSTRDLAKLGYLLLNHGVWEDRQIIEPDFVAAATSRQVAGGWPMYADYGYQWWIPTSDDVIKGYFANGYGGQYIYVLPHLDVVAVMTANAESPIARIQPFLIEFVLPALA